MIVYILSSELKYLFVSFCIKYILNNLHIASEYCPEKTSNIKHPRICLFGVRYTIIVFVTKIMKYKNMETLF